MIDAADAVIGGVGFRKTPAASGLEIGRHEGEARPVGNVLQRRAAKEMAVVSGGDNAGRGHARQQAEKRGLDIDPDRGETDERIGDLFGEVAGAAIRIKAKGGPGPRELAGGD